MWNSLSLKKHVARRYIPSSMKWKLVLKGLGKLYGAIGDELEKGESGSSSAKALADAAYRVGFDFGEDLKEELKLGSSIEDVAVAMDLEHKVFGMKASCREERSKNSLSLQRVRLEEVLHPEAVRRDWTSGKGYSAGSQSEGQVSHHPNTNYGQGKMHLRS
jgi:hypothetical protein